MSRYWTNHNVYITVGWEIFTVSWFNALHDYFTIFIFAASSKTTAKISLLPRVKKISRFDYSRKNRENLVTTKISRPTVLQLVLWLKHACCLVVQYTTAGGMAMDHDECSTLQQKGWLDHGGVGLTTVGTSLDGRW